jgi:hypothetical protein
LCLTNQNSEHEAILKIYRVITGLGDLTLLSQIRDKLREPGQKTDEHLDRALANLKDVLHYPAKEDAVNYPWAPLLLVLCGVGSAGLREPKVSVRRARDAQPVEFNNFESAMEWVNSLHPRTAFLDGLTLPVPRYEMLLVFLANIMAYFRSEQATGNLQGHSDLISVTEEKEKKIWKIVVDFGVRLRRDRSARQTLRDRMYACYESGSWPTYVGNFHGPFLAFAAECGFERTRSSHEIYPNDDNTIFVVDYMGVTSAIAYENEVLSIRFERLS